MRARPADPFDKLPEARGDLLGQKQRVRAGGAQHGGLQVLHHLQLLLGVAGPHRHGHRAQALGAQLKADARRPQAVPGRDLDTVGVRDARRFVAARELNSPIDHVLGRVRDDDRRARGSAGTVDAHNLLVGHGLQAQRVHAAQIVLLGERQFLEILLGLDIGQIDVRELLGVEGRTVFEGFELLFDKAELLGRKFHGKPPSRRWTR